jgi:hypothetical protein
LFKYMALKKMNAAIETTKSKKVQDETILAAASSFAPEKGPSSPLDKPRQPVPGSSKAVRRLPTLKGKERALDSVVDDFVEQSSSREIVTEQGELPDIETSS